VVALGNPPRVAIKTLGCKLNQYESEQMREDFLALGFDVAGFDDPADVYLINSCTVTHRTDRDTRRLARQARRREPDSLVVVTGCYAELQPEALRRIGEIDLILGNDDKPRLARIAAERLAEKQGAPVSPVSQREPDRLIHTFSGHTRAFIKIQNGCDARCAYCTIPLARGPSRSVPREQVLRQANLLAASHPELVLVGVHIGRYGLDLAEPRASLVDLVRNLCDLPDLGRLRLSSIEPREVTPELTDLVCAGGRCLPPDPERPALGKLCRHLHIPLQSGCDATLERMGRPYRRDLYAELVRGVATREPLVSIGADVIVGFPGETAEEFAQTVEFVRSLPLAYLHVFTYSKRPGTAAAEMPDQVNPEVRKQRNHLLRDLSEQKARRFAEAAVGQRLEVVVEAPRDEAGRLLGISDNYLRVAFDGPDDLVGKLVAVEVESLEGMQLAGRLP